jgi:hypothetical protein
MKNFNCQSLTHIGLWSTLPQVQMSAFAGKTQPSIRTSYNDEGLPGSFIERGVGSK